MSLKFRTIAYVSTPYRSDARPVFGLTIALAPLLALAEGAAGLVMIGWLAAIVAV